MFKSRYVVLVLAFCVFSQRDAVKAQPLTPANVKSVELNEKVRLALDKKLAWDFDAAALSDVVRVLRGRTELDIAIDDESLDNNGTALDTKLSLKAKRLSLRAGLNHLLGDTELGWSVSDGTLVISALTDASLQTITEVYSLRDLLPPDADRSQRREFVTELISKAKQHLSPEEWQESSGQGTMSSVGASLVVRQNWQTHDRLRRMLTCLRQSMTLAEGKKATDGGLPSVVSWRVDEPESEDLRRLRNQPAGWPFDEITLSGLVDFLEAKYGLTVIVDEDALSSLGLDRDVLLKAKLAGATVEHALTRLLSSRELRWLVKDEAVFITNLDETFETLELRVYSVAGLINPSSKDNANADLPELATVVSTIFDIPEAEGESAWGRNASHLGALLVLQTRENHEQLENLLSALGRIGKRAKDGSLDVVELSAEQDAPVRAALAKEANLDFRELSLVDSAKALSAKFGVPVRLDIESLESLGIEKGQLVGEQAIMMSLAKALDRLFLPLELSWCVRDGAIIITAEEQPHIRLYPIPDLLETAETAEEREQLREEFKAAVENGAVPDAWRSVGGVGVVELLYGTRVLVVSQTEAGQRDVAALLGALRRARRAEVDERK